MQQSRPNTLLQARELSLRQLWTLHPDLVNWIVEDAFGKVFSRPGLSLKEREMANVAVLCMQEYGPQLYSHLRGALLVGVTPACLRQSLNALARLKGVSARNAEQSLDELLVSSLRRL